MIFEAPFTYLNISQLLVLVHPSLLHSGEMIAAFQRCKDMYLFFLKKTKKPSEKNLEQWL